MSKNISILIYYPRIKYIHLIIHFKLTNLFKIIRFDALIINFGAIAQLGERLNGIQEVRSSILLSSTFLGVDLLNSTPFLLNSVKINIPS